MGKAGGAVLSASLEGARRLAVTKQHLAGKLPTRATDEQILSVVGDLPYVQWDPIDAVAPSHIISLWSRLGKFRPSDLDRLLWDEKKLFLFWAPMASIVLTEDYPLYNSLMKRYSELLSRSTSLQVANYRKFVAGHRDLQKRILKQLESGPLLLNQFKDYVRTGRSEDGWSSGSDVSRMLFYLLKSGEVMVVGHQGIQNVWGLTESFLPAGVVRKELSEEEFEHEAAQKAIRALGIAFAREIYLYFPRDRYRSLEKTLEHLEAESIIHPIEVKGLDSKNKRYIHEKDIPLLESMSTNAWQPRMTLLAPFDNLLGDRARTNRLFGFDYMHENFLPENKRKYGTFVHPILWGDRIIGRADLLKDKASGRLLVKSVHAEPGATGDKTIGSSIAETMEKFGEFLGSKEVVYTSKVPQAWKSSLR
ncbi:MAG TPA: crosslink repair DNA glycosylase YcaQ family protein [Candidatus Bathyarchaeia archaeon]|nr:crosslink repair DNA glycosylase YcaQ family protein [Candidatus Bathyarchaeia archaeon]